MITSRRKKKPLLDEKTANSVWPASFTAALSYAKSSLPRGAANTPLAMQVSAKFYSRFDKYFPHLDEMPRLQRIVEFNKILKAHRSDAISLDCTIEELEVLPTVVSMALLGSLFQQETITLGSAGLLHAVFSRFEIYKLFGVGNCGAHCMGALAYLIQHAPDCYPLQILEVRKKKPVISFPGFPDPEDGHQVVVKGSLEDSENCVVIDVVQNKIFYFRDWNQEMPAGLQWQKLNEDESGTYFPLESKPTIDLSQVIKFSAEEEQGIKFLLKKMINFFVLPHFIIKHYNLPSPPSFFATPQKAREKDEPSIFPSNLKMLT